jgi:ABC-type lipoprotein release transport system permease subunit
MWWTFAWRNLWRQRRRTIVTCTAMAIGIAMTMGIVCFQDGFNQEMERVMVDQRLGHIQINHSDYPGRRSMHDVLGGVEARIAALESDGSVADLTVRLNGPALVGGETKSEGAFLVGVDPDREDAFTDVSSMVVEGRYLASDRANEVVLGVQLAAKIEAKVGTEVVVVTQAADGSMGNELFLVVGILSTGDARLDRGGGHLHIKDMQTLLVLDDSAHELTLRVHDENMLASVKSLISANPGAAGATVRTWAEVDPQVEKMLAMNQSMNFFIMMIVLVVAGIVVLNTMMMVVYERTHELGVLQALGMRPGGVLKLIAMEAMCLTTVSVALGLILGGLLDWYFVSYGVKFLDGDLTFAGVRFSGRMYGVVEANMIVITVVSAYVISILAAGWPAWRASRMNPVEAMREN